MTDPRDRQAAQKRGQRAEVLCAFWLRLKGYRVLARNWRVSVGEVDIVARRGQILAFIEVKRRDDMATAMEAVQPRQRQRIEQAAKAWLASHPECANMHARFDVMTVAPGQRPRHIRAAWGMD